MRVSFISLWPIFSLIFTNAIGNETEESPGLSIEKQFLVLRISPAWLNDLEGSYKIGARLFEFEDHWGESENYQHLRLDRPYSEAIPEYKYTGNARINLPKVLNLKKSISEKRQFFFSNNSILNLNEMTQIPALNLCKCKQLHFTESQVVKENVTESSRLNRFIQAMIKNPMVRLFIGENLTGDFEDFHVGKFSDTKGCFHLRNGSIKVKSAETF
ncbi:unnamed protein product, partial [Allacma fusca]